LPPSSSSGSPNANIPPGLPGVTTPLLPNSPNASLPAAPLAVPGTAAPLNSTTTGLQNLAPGTLLTESSQASKNGTTAGASANPPDSGLGGLVTAGIVVASVVVASMIGIFLFRKWKLRPKSRDARWRATTLDPFAPTSNLPLHHAMQQHHQVLSRNPSLTRSDSGGRGVYGGVTAPPPVAVGYGPPPPNAMGQHGWGNAPAANPDMDLMLRHHLRNG